MSTIADLNGRVEQAPPRRGRGRPRDPGVEAAALHAARELLHERGFAGCSMAAIAARAGVGKGTIYLRWPDKESVVADAVAEVVGTAHPPETGSLRDDLVALMHEQITRLQGPLGSLLRSIVSELHRAPRLRQVYVGTVLAPWRASVDAVVERAVARGELRPDLDRVLFVEVLFGPLIGRLMLGGAPLTPEVATASVDLVLRGAAPGPAG